MSIITTPRLGRLWRDAQVHPEWATSRLWEYIFNRMVFSSDQWVVSSQQPPTHQPGELRRVDLVVELDSGPAIGTLLFVEMKRASATPADIDEVEYQAFTAACAYCLDVDSGNPIWAMTCVGSTARLWVFDWGADYLIPYFPEGSGLGARQEYVEISVRGTELIHALNYIKAHPIPPKHLVKKPASPRPANATLPEGWHDNEVRKRDASSQPPSAAVASQAYATTSQDSAWPTRGAAVPDSNVSQEGYVGEPVEQEITSPMTVEDVSQWDYGQSSMQEPTYRGTATTAGDVRQWDYGQSSTQGPNDDDEMEASTSAANPGSQSAEAWVKVDVRRVSHFSRPDEYVFITKRGHDKSTNKNDWKQTEYKGKKAWYYQHRGTKYYTRKVL